VGVEDVFSSALRDLEDTADEEVDAALAGQIHLYLRGTFDTDTGCWRGRDEHDTLRRTCHAVEVLHHLRLDADSAAMVRDAGNWLINLPIHDHLAHGERARAELYPSRFKTLAYLGRFEDELVRRDFAELLRQSIDGMVRGVTESDVLTTCIVMDTLLSLDATGIREEICPDERFAVIGRALAQQLRLWRPQGEQLRARRNPHAAMSSTLVRTRRRAVTGSEITNARDLSYTLGLALQQGVTLASRQVALITEHLIATIDQRDRIRGSDLAHALYAALQLAEHFREDERAQRALSGLLADIRAAYVSPDALRRWEFSHHTQVMRLLDAHYGASTLTQRIVARFLRTAERSRESVQDTLATELRHVIQERIEIELGDVIELSGGFTSDHIYRVPFIYWYPLPG